MGAGVRIPSLTFMLPEGSGTEDLAAAVRTQVLRQVANRQLDPGSLDNLRLAISSRELGQVEVDLKASGDRLEVKIVTAGREAESVLRRTSGDLKEALLARTDRFRDVEVKVENRAAAEEEKDGGDGHHGREPGQGNSRQPGGRFDDPRDPDSGPEQEG
jgi:flagellar hook-length control protein FliK